MRRQLTISCLFFLFAVLGCSQSEREKPDPMLVQQEKAAERQKRESEDIDRQTYHDQLYRQYLNEKGGDRNVPVLNENDPNSAGNGS
jgi:hypothetical protein